MVNIEMVPIAEIDYLVPDSSFHLPLFLVQQAPRDSVVGGAKGFVM